MTNATKRIAGLLLIAVTTIEYGGTFLLGILSGKYAVSTEFQHSMVRAGRAHAGVLTTLALQIGFSLRQFERRFHDQVGNRHHV